MRLRWRMAHGGAYSESSRRATGALELRWGPEPYARLGVSAPRPTIRLCVSGLIQGVFSMPKTSKANVRPSKSRTSGQSATAGDEKSVHSETEKTANLTRDTVEPGEVMTGNQGVKISDDQNSLKAGGRR
jgi:hypothetical protein